MYTTPISTPAPIQVEVTGQGATIGQGGFIPVPVGTTNGAPIGSKPSGAVGVKLYLTGSDSVSYTIATAQPTSPPTVYTITASTVSAIVYEELSTTAQVYVTARSGSPLFRWI